jgi:hypothetical protein
MVSSELPKLIIKSSTGAERKFQAEVRSGVIVVTLSATTIAKRGVQVGDHAVVTWFWPASETPKYRIATDVQSILLNANARFPGSKDPRKRKYELILKVRPDEKVKNGL